MAKTCVIVFGCLFAAVVSCFAQVKSDVLLEHIVSTYYESEGEPDLESLREEIDALLDNPIHINEAGEEELGRLFFLSTEDCSAIIGYRDAYGPFLSGYELAAIDGISVSKARDMMEFITFSAMGRKQERFSSETVMLGSMSLPADTGMGLPGKLRFSTRVSRGDVSIKLLADHDKGEIFNLNKAPFGFDHYACNLTWNPNRKISQVVIGTYRLDFGNGNLESSSFAVGSGSGMGTQTASFRLTSSGLSAEAGYYQGSAAMIRHKLFSGLAAVSYARRDGSFDSIDGKFGINYDPSGYHLTSASRLRQNALTELMLLMGANYTGKHLKVGMIGSHYTISHRESQARTNFPLVSGYAECRWRSLSVRGEVNQLEKEGLIASVNVRMVHPAGVSARLNASYRSPELKWMQDFRPGGMTGSLGAIYWGLQMRPVHSWRIETGISGKWSEAEWGPPSSPSLSGRVDLTREGRVLFLARASMPLDGDGKPRLTLRVRWEPAERYQTTFLLSGSSSDVLSGFVFRKLNKDGKGFTLRYYGWRIQEQGTMLYAWVNDVPGLGRIASFSRRGSQMSFELSLGRKPRIDLGVQSKWNTDAMILPDQAKVANPMPKIEISTRVKF